MDAAAGVPAVVEDAGGLSSADASRQSADGSEALDGAEAGTEAADAGPTEVAITLRGVPDGAIITVDGRTVESPELAVPADGASHVIRVFAEGYRPWNHRFVPSADETFDIQLQRRRGRRRPRSPPP